MMMSDEFIVFSLVVDVRMLWLRNACLFSRTSDSFFSLRNLQSSEFKLWIGKKITNLLLIA